MSPSPVTMWWLQNTPQGKRQLARMGVQPYRRQEQERQEREDQERQERLDKQRARVK